MLEAGVAAARGSPHVGLEEHRWRRRAWQVSQTLTGFGEAGRGSSLSEQLLQNISPQFLQWCWTERETETGRTTIHALLGFFFFLSIRHLTTDLPSRDGELLLTQLAMAGLLVLQPNLTPLKHSKSV